MNNYERKKEFLKENLKEIQSFLDDDEIIEIMFNQDSNLFVEKIGLGKENLGNKIINPIRAKQIIELVASYDEKNINKDNPIISAILPTGERFEGILYEPVAYKPVFCIRKKTKNIFSLDELENMGTISKEYSRYIKKAILDKKNILIVGGTSSGKTTFLNACLKVLEDSNERIAVLEDTPELRLNVENSIFLKTTENVSMAKLLRSTMRMNVDRIIVGEVRKGEESLELLKAWNSGHEGGLSTIHANSGLNAGLIKLEMYLGEVSEKNQKNVILEAVDVVVNMVKENNIRKVKEISELLGYDDKNKLYKLQKI